MKKILATIVGLVVGASLVHAQGILELNSGSAFAISTNSGTFGNPTVPNASAGFGTIINGHTSTAALAPFSYDYTYLFIPTGQASPSDSNNIASSDWVQLAQDVSGSVGAALAGTNVAGVAGNWGGQNGANGQASIGIGGQAFNNGSSYSIARLSQR